MSINNHKQEIADLQTRHKSELDAINEHTVSFMFSIFVNLAVFAKQQLLQLLRTTRAVSTDGNGYFMLFM